MINDDDDDDEDGHVVIHKETELTDGAQPVDHHFLLSGQPLEINMYDEDAMAQADDSIDSKQQDDD